MAKCRSCGASILDETGSAQAAARSDALEVSGGVAAAATIEESPWGRIWWPAQELNHTSAFPVAGRDIAMISRNRWTAAPVGAGMLLVGSSVDGDLVVPRILAPAAASNAILACSSEMGVIVPVTIVPANVPQTGPRKVRRYRHTYLIAWDLGNGTPETREMGIWYVTKSASTFAASPNGVNTDGIGLHWDLAGNLLISLYRRPLTPATGAGDEEIAVTWPGTPGTFNRVDFIITDSGVDGSPGSFVVELNGTEIFNRLLNGANMPRPGAGVVSGGNQLRQYVHALQARRDTALAQTSLFIQEASVQLETVV